MGKGRKAAMDGRLDLGYYPRLKGRFAPLWPWHAPYSPYGRPQYPQSQPCRHIRDPPIFSAVPRDLKGPPHHEDSVCDSPDRK